MGGDIYWLGSAVAVAQVVTIAITGYDATTTYKITVGGIVISVVGSGGTTTTVATALAAAWNASTHPYAAAMTASSNTATVTLTADTAGVPFVVTSSVSGGAGTIGAATTATASAGPNDWSTAANWSGGAIPATDNVYIRNSNIPILWGLAQTAVTPSLILIEQTFTNYLGLFASKFTTAAGSYNSTVPEYRTQYLGIAATSLRIGENYGSGQSGGSGLIKIDLQSANAAAVVFNSGQTADSITPAVRLKMNHASATLKIYGGKVGVCWEQPGETGQLSEIDVYGGVGNPELYAGAGVTLATHRQFAGSGVLKSLPTSLYIESQGTVTMANTAGGTITTLEKRGQLLPAGAAFAVTNLRG